MSNRVCSIPVGGHVKLHRRGTGSVYRGHRVGTVVVFLTSTKYYNILIYERYTRQFVIHLCLIQNNKRTVFKTNRLETRHDYRLDCV